jgi:hypothetical protein
MPNKMNYSSDIIKRFWDKVHYPGNDQDCWEWTACRWGIGYGCFALTIPPQRKKSIMAHRFAWEFYNGPIPSNLNVLHKCDNPPCCNPEHLFLGTASDNMCDRDSKNRNAHGSTHGNSKLSEKILENIINDTLSGKITSMSQITNTHNVSRVTIRKILSGYGWNHVISKYSKSDMEKILEILNDNTSLSPVEVIDIKNRIKNGESNSSIARSYNVYASTISSIKTGKTWKHIII